MQFSTDEHRTLEGLTVKYILPNHQHFSYAAIIQMPLTYIIVRRSCTIRNAAAQLVKDPSAHSGALTLISRNAAASATSTPNMRAIVCEGQPRND